LLRKSSLEQYKRQIPISHLPRLFQDVVEVARKLDIRYLWIDAYCIIQGDVVDWEKEAARMGEIYQHAILNIAAGGAPDTNASLMVERNTALVEPSKVIVDWRDLAKKVGRPPESWYPAGSYYVFDALYIEGQMLETPLNHRAWVMQEQQLSSRILHFGKHQLFWHCWGDHGYGHQACETLPKGTPTNVLGFSRAHPYVLQTLVPSTWGEDPAMFLHLLWHRLVMSYSRCGITRETDKLIAISGLARRFAEILPESARYDGQLYAAGIWLRSLSWSLCWHVDINPLSLSPRSYRYSSFVAPSWSWASVKGHIKLHDSITYRDLLNNGMEFFALADSFQINMEHVMPENPFGQVKNGQISLSGYIVPAENLIWFWNKREDRERGQGQNCRTCGLFPHFTFLHCNFDDIKDYESRKRKWVGLPYFFKAPGIDLLPLVYWKHPSQKRESLCEGIIVVRDVASNVYRRIGYFSSNDSTLKVAGNPEHIVIYMKELTKVILV
jgi:hypothetical protein